MLTSRFLAMMAFLVASGAHAQASGPAQVATSAPPAVGASTSQAMSDGEVRKVDRDQGKLTLKHGPIANLEMPPMTMVFKVADPKMLDGLKAGDKVRFAADRVNGAITVTAIEPASR